MPEVTASAPSKILTEQTLGLAAAARLFPSLRAGRPVHTRSVWRWVKNGVRLPDGTILKLEAAKTAGYWITSKEAVARFVDRLTTPDPAAASPTPPTVPSEHEARLDREEQRVRELCGSK